MNKLQACLLASACVALAGAAGFATSANATTCQGDTNCSLGANAYTFTDNDAFGGGSSLIAPYWRQTSDCYANPADLITKGSPPTFVDEALFNWTGTHPQDCATQTIITNATTWYISTGSGSGILGVFSHDPVPFWGQVNTNGPQYFPTVSYALSDAGLGSTDVNAYNNGGSYSQGSTTISIGAPNQVTCTSGSTNPYPNPAQCYGPLIQFPASVDPIDVFYTNSGVYEQVSNGTKTISYKLNVQNNGRLRLSVSSLCAIYNGQITSWNDTRLVADNNGISLEDPNDGTPPTSWAVPLYAVGRSDSSGTTSIVTRHLANVCAQYGYNLYTTGATTLQKAGPNVSSIIGNTYNVSNPNYPGVDISGKITLAPNSSGIAQYVAFTQAPNSTLGNSCPNWAVLPAGYNECVMQSRVGYVGNDYVYPFVKNSHTNNYKLFPATLQNSSGNWIKPTVSAVLKAFGSIQPPQSDSNGNYCSSCLNWGMRNDPTAWVEGLDPGQLLANPTASGAYPLVGTTNLLAYTCYVNSKRVSTLSGQADYLETATIETSTKGVLGLSGLAPLPHQWRNAIDGTFIKDTDGLHLNMNVAGSTGPCSASGILGG